MGKKINRGRVNRGMHQDKFMKWFIPASQNAKRTKLPHEYLSGIYSIIRNYNKWNKKRHGKSIREYLSTDVLQYLKDNEEVNRVLELEELLETHTTDEELLGRANFIKESKGVNF